jgi:hypothetical protein
MSCQPGDAIAEPMLLLDSADSLPAVSAAAANSQQPSLVDLAVMLCNGAQQGGPAVHGIDIGPPCRLRLVSLLWLEYADSLLYKQYKTLDPCLHEERAAVANSGGKAGSGALATASSSTRAAAACSKVRGASGMCDGRLMASQRAAAVVAKQVDSTALGEELFFERTGAVNTTGGAQGKLLLHTIRCAAVGLLLAALDSDGSFIGVHCFMR